MRFLRLISFSFIVLLVACGGGDPKAEIQTLVDQGKIVEAKSKYREVIAAGKTAGIEREYIRFLFEQKQYLDFRKEVKKFLAANPDDQEIRTLQFDYYAKLATDAEKTENYRTALNYIVTRLLSPDYPEYRKWESRQTTVLKKWYEKAKSDEDPNLQKEVMVQMKNLGFDNLALSLDPKLYKSIEEQASSSTN